MVQFNNVFVFGHEAELEKFDAETHALVIADGFLDDFFGAERRPVNNLYLFAVEKDFFIADVGQKQRQHDSRADQNDDKVKESRIHKRLVNDVSLVFRNEVKIGPAVAEAVEELVETQQNKNGSENQPRIKNMQGNSVGLFGRQLVQIQHKAVAVVVGRGIGHLFCPHFIVGFLASLCYIIFFK